MKANLSLSPQVSVVASLRVRIFVSKTHYIYTLYIYTFCREPIKIHFKDEDSGSCSLRETAVAGGVAVALVLIVSIATVAAITVCLRKDLCCTVRCLRMLLHALLMT